MEAAPEVDWHDPLVRYQLIGASTYDGVQKAYIKDLKVGEARLIKVGEMIGDCQLIEIAPGNRSVRLKPPGGPEFTLDRSRPARK